MATARRFVLVTVSSGNREQYAVFLDEGDAGMAYFEAHHQCVDGRPRRDPVIDCSLHEIAAVDEDEAIRLVMVGEGKLLNKFEPPDDE
jgi:hypothetical protein